MCQGTQGQCLFGIYVIVFCYYLFCPVFDCVLYYYSCPTLFDMLQEYGLLKCFIIYYNFRGIYLINYYPHVYEHGLKLVLERVPRR